MKNGLLRRYHSIETLSLQGKATKEQVATARAAYDADFARRQAAYHQFKETDGAYWFANDSGEVLTVPQS
jgi:hypothetical protein